MTLVCSYALVDELCDETRFEKHLGPSLAAIEKSRLGGSLFISWTEDPRWRRAHNILLPAFGMDAIRGYHPKMLDIVDRMMRH